MARRALVTGAGVRVGRATALELAAHGFDVAVHYRGSQDEADAVAEACRAHGVQAWTVQADMARPDHIARMASQVGDRWDGLELVVNNASIFAPRPFDEITVEHWDQMQAVNVRGPFLLCQAVLPLLRAADAESGLVVHMCDIGAERPVSGYAAYSVSKAALVMLVKAMAVELAPAVRAVGVAPGHVVWPADYDNDKRARLERRIPMRRVGTAQDVARLIRFLALEAPYVNGDVVAVDGGLGSRY